MAVLTNSAEGGSSGTTATQGVGGNTGGASGNFLDTVSIGTSATLTFDNAHAAHGGLAYKFTTPAVATFSFFYWGATLGTGQTKVWFRTYVYLPALPGAAARLMSCWATTTGSTAVEHFILGTGGTISVGLGAAMTTTSVMPTNQWFRLEGFVSTSGASLSYYSSPDSVTATETKTNATVYGTIGSYGFGPSAAVASVTYWLDDVGISTVSALGPSGGAAAPAVSPAAPGKTWLRRFHHRQALPPPAPSAATVSADAAVAGTVTITAAGTSTVLGAASVAETVTITAAATDTVLGAAAVAGTVTITAAGTTTALAAAAVAPAVTITASATVGAGPISADVALSETVTITATGTTTALAAASAVETVTITATGTGTRLAAAAVAETVTITAAGTGTRLAAAAAAETVTITAAGTSTVLGAAAVSSAVTITATATVGSAPISADAALTETVTIAAAGTGTRLAAAAVAPAVTITAAGTGTRAAAATVPETVTITAAGTSTVRGAAAVAAAVTITADLFVPLPFTVGALSATQTPTATQAPADRATSAATASVGPSSAITATDTRTGGPG